MNRRRKKDVDRGIRFWRWSWFWSRFFGLICGHGTQPWKALLTMGTLAVVMAALTLGLVVAESMTWDSATQEIVHAMGHFLVAENVPTSLPLGYWVPAAVLAFCQVLLLNIFIVALARKYSR